MSGRWRARVEGASLNLESPLHQAGTVDPALKMAIARPEAEAAVEVRAQLALDRQNSLGLHASAGVARHSANAPLESVRSGGHGQLHEAVWTVEQGAWAFTAGRKVLSWDVGWGFRPNDVVQQEQRGTLLAQPLTGVGLLALEHFGADHALTLVAANPHHANAPFGAHPLREEAALAARAYWRLGAVDLHGFARMGRHTRESLGVAVAWIASDAVELHASVRHARRHARWQAAPISAALVAAEPYNWALQGAAVQAALGGSWTGSQRQSLLLEWWYDGQAPGSGDWLAWQSRNDTLRSLAGAPGVPANALGANLAWQALPLATPGGGSALHRHNLLARFAWETGPWTLATEVLWHPADDGVALTPSLQWQGDRVTVKAAARHFGGPAKALLRQVPERTQWSVAAEWSF